MVEARADTREVPETVAVGVGEGTHVDLVDNCLVPPGTAVGGHVNLLHWNLSA